MPLKFRKVLIADERFESAAFIDVNNNGVLDIVSGEWWYEGPDFKIKHRIGTVKPEGEYYDDFSTIAMDINGSGLPGFITGGWLTMGMVLSLPMVLAGGWAMANARPLNQQ